MPNSKNPMIPLNLKLWEFIRGDLPIPQFEQFLYSTPQLQQYLGETLYAEAIENDYNNKDTTFTVKKALAAYLRTSFPTDCACIELQNLSVLPMGGESAEALDTFIRIADRGMPYWWLYLSECTKCHQYWLIAQEERQNDVFCLQRVEPSYANMIITRNQWPSVFNKYETLLVIGMEAGHRVRFSDPVNSRSIQYTIIDLANENPGMKVSWLSQLLNLDVETTIVICKPLMRREKLNINLNE